MSERITLKSRLLREGDPMQVDLSQFKIPLTVDQALYERDLINFRRRFAATEDAASVEKNDTAILSCTADSPRFCKEHISIRVGLGLFSKELEAQIIGWRPGQTGTVTVKDQPVTVTVEAVRREVLPEVDGALAARCGIPGIATAEDILRYCKGKQFDDVLEGPADDAFPYLVRCVMESSEFQLAPEEVAFSEEMMLRQINWTSILGGKTLEEATDADFLERFDTAKEDFLKSIRESGRYCVQGALIGMAMLERAGRAPTEDDYIAWLRRYTEGGARTEEEARREHPQLEYLLNEAEGYFDDELEALTLRRLEEDAL